MCLVYGLFMAYCWFMFGFRYGICVVPLLVLLHMYDVSVFPVYVQLLSGLCYWFTKWCLRCGSIMSGL